MIILSKIRAFLVAVVRRPAGPVWRALRWRIEVIAADRAEAAAQPVRAEVAELRKEFRTARHNLRRDLDQAREHLDQARDHLGRLQGDLDRISQYQAALDQRLAEIERPAVALNGDAEPAHDLVAEVRAEHARIRARLTAIALYEERIGRLEQSLPST